ncbi:MAG: hypothetical protein NWE83_07035 [Candidatus Bathyarchaeota archaeon]|nr:hypothetical protein [Candidatus Bathyarchaeota archaeon]
MGKRRISIDDLQQFRFISDPQVSPDGRKVAFVHTTIDYNKQCCDKHIWIWNAQIDSAEQFTSRRGNDFYPRWSPNGQYLFFLSKRHQLEKQTQLYVISSTGGEARLVASVEGGHSEADVGARFTADIVFIPCLD